MDEDYIAGDNPFPEGFQDPPGLSTELSGDSPYPHYGLMGGNADEEYLQYSGDGSGSDQQGMSGGYDRALEQYNENRREAQDRAEGDRSQALSGAEGLYAANPYGPEFLAMARNQLRDERSRQLMAGEAKLNEHYASMGRTTDPRVLALLRNQVAQQGNADLRDLQISTAGKRFDATARAEEAVRSVLMGTNYDTGAADLNRLLQMYENGIRNKDADALRKQYDDMIAGINGQTGTVGDYDFNRDAQLNIGNGNAGNPLDAALWEYRPQPIEADLTLGV